MRRRFLPRAAARRIRRLLRSPVAFLLAAVALGVVTVGIMNGLTGQARADAAALGGLRSVPVATHALDAGDEIGAGDMTMRRLPTRLIPRGAVATRAEGRIAVVPIAPGEVLLQSKLAPWGLRGAAALLPQGTRALAVPVGGGTPPLAVGNHVDLLAAFSPDRGAASPDSTSDSTDTGTSSSDPSFAVAEDALVIAIGHDTITVAVDQDAAPSVAYAIAAGTIVVALTGS
jgi:Flp pilus assembly protein CpaB